MFAKIVRSRAPHFLAAKQSENHRAFWFCAGAQHASEFQHGGTAGGIIVGAVVNTVSVDWLAYADVIKVGRKQNCRVL